MELRSNIWASIKVIAPSAGYVKGQMTKVEDTVGVIVDDADNLEEAVLVYSCEAVEVPKTAGTGITFAAGDKVYFDAAAGAVTNVSSGNTLCGRAKEAATTTDDVVIIDLKGNIAA